MKLVVAAVFALIAMQSAIASCNPVYKVKPNGKATTRPAYTLVDGVLSKKVVARAPVGAVCNVHWPTKPSGKDVWAVYDIGTGYVALCSKRS